MIRSRTRACLYCPHPLRRYSCRRCANRRHVRGGFSLLELLAVISIMGILAVVALPRIGRQSQQTKRTACEIQRGEIEVQAQLWYRNRGHWPAEDLRDIAGNADYFPAGLPACPVDGTSYRFDARSGKVAAHAH